MREKIYQRAKEINEVEKRLISEGKTPYERNEEPMQESKEYKILMRMKHHYGHDDGDAAKYDGDDA